MIVEYESDSLVIHFTSDLEKNYFKERSLLLMERLEDEEGFYGFKLVFNGKN